MTERESALYARQQLSRAEWQSYVRALYRASVAELPLLPRIDEVDVIYHTRLHLAELERAPWRTYHCEWSNRALVPFLYRAPHSPSIAWLYRAPPFTPLPAHSWAEVRDARQGEDPHTSAPAQPRPLSHCFQFSLLSRYQYMPLSCVCVAHCMCVVRGR